MIYECIVVGSGPVGIVAINELILRGYKNILLVEGGNHISEISSKYSDIPLKAHYSHGGYGGLSMIWGGMVCQYSSSNKFDNYLNNIELQKYVLEKYFSKTIEFTDSYFIKNFYGIFPPINFYKKFRNYIKDITINDFYVTKVQKCQSIIKIISLSGNVLYTKNLFLACNVFNNLEIISDLTNNNKYIISNNIKGYIGEINIKNPISIDKLSNIFGQIDGDVMHFIGYKTNDYNYIRFEPYYPWGDLYLIKLLTNIYSKIIFKKKKFIYGSQAEIQSEETSNIKNINDVKNFFKYLLFRIGIYKPVINKILIRVFMHHNNIVYDTKSRNYINKIDNTQLIELKNDVMQYINVAFEDLITIDKINLYENPHFIECSHYSGGCKISENQINEKFSLDNYDNIYILGSTVIQGTNSSSPTLAAMMNAVYVIDQFSNSNL